MSLFKEGPGPLVKLAEITAASKGQIGDRLVTGNYFACLRPGIVCEVFKDTNGHMFVECAHGRHYLEYSVEPDMASFCTRQPRDDENGFLTGFYRYDPDGA